MSITSPIVAAVSSSRRSRSLDRKLRVHMTHFAEDLGSEDLSNLCYVHQVPRGVRERNRNSGIDLIRYLEENGTLGSEEEIVRMMRDLNKEDWARKREHMIGICTRSTFIAALSVTAAQALSTMQASATYTAYLNVIITCYTMMRISAACTHQLHLCSYLHVVWRSQRSALPRWCEWSATTD